MKLLGVIVMIVVFTLSLYVIGICLGIDKLLQANNMVYDIIFLFVHHTFFSRAYNRRQK